MLIKNLRYIFIGKKWKDMWFTYLIYLIKISGVKKSKKSDHKWVKFIIFTSSILKSFHWFKKTRKLKKMSKIFQMWFRSRGVLRSALQSLDHNTGSGFTRARKTEWNARSGSISGWSFWSGSILKFMKETSSTWLEKNQKCVPNWELVFNCWKLFLLISSWFWWKFYEKC